MAEKSNLGLWTAISGGRKSFELEAQRAVEVGAEWRCDKHQRDIIFEWLPGWLSPLWGSDGEWLYLRRPEGIWKTKIPVAANEGIDAAIYQKDEAGNVLGGLSIGHNLISKGGWIEGVALGNTRDAGDVDDFAKPSNRGLSIQADAIGPTLVKVIANEPDRFLIHAKDSFNTAPTFELDGDWLLARDARTGRTVAYGMKPNYLGFKAMQEGRLWLRYSGKWMKGFDVHVNLAKG